MNFLHWDFIAGPDNVVCVSLNAQANVLLMDDINFQAYRARRSYRYHGGHAKRSPVRLVPPHEGHWHVVVDLGGASGRLQASVAVA